MLQVGHFIDLLVNYVGFARRNIWFVEDPVGKIGNIEWKILGNYFLSNILQVGASTTLIDLLSFI